MDDENLLQGTTWYGIVCLTLTQNVTQKLSGHHTRYVSCKYKIQLYQYISFQRYELIDTTLILRGYL